MPEVQFPPGILRGATEAEHTGRWYDSNGVRWRDGRLMPLGGVDRLSANPLSSPVRCIYTARDANDIPRAFLGSDTGLTVLEGSSYTNITPTGFAGATSSGLARGFGVGPFGKGKFGTPRAVGTVTFTAGNNWSIDSYGNDVLAVSASDGRLLRWSATAPSAAVTVVPNAPTDLTAMVVTAERHAVVISGRRVMWSDRENVAGWDFANTDTQAGFLDLLDAPSALKAATKVKDGTLIFSETTLDLLQYVKAPTYYGLFRVANGITLLSASTIAAVNTTCYWMGRNGFWMYESGACSPMPCDIAAAIFSNDPVYGIDPIYSRLYAHASVHGNFQEVWFHYCSKGSTVPNRIAVYNFAEGWWALHNSINRTAMCGAGVFDTPLAGGSDKHLYRFDTAGTMEAGTSRVGQVYLESNALSPGGQAVVLRGELDNGSGDPAATRVIVKARLTRDGPVKTFGPYTPKANGYTAMRAGGSDLRLRIEATTDAGFSIGNMRFTVTQGGNR